MQAVVIGAGVVGLATARALALAGCDVIVIEAADIIGSGTSSRNSEVVHGGMFTRRAPARRASAWRAAGCCTLSARATACPIANAANSSSPPATPRREDRANRRARPTERRLEGLEMLTGAAAREAEPALACTAALWSPETASSTATPTCWRCRVTSRPPAARSPSRRRSSPSTAWARPGASPSAGA